jgi:hypothetical protein
MKGTFSGGTAASFAETMKRVAAEPEISLAEGSVLAVRRVLKAPNSPMATSRSLKRI